jgi:hypothetical protein
MGTRICNVADCGRPVSARGLCQTHYRQQRAGGDSRPIRPYRKRRSGTRKLQGLSISHDCAEAIEERAERSGRAAAAIIADVLEAWARHQRKPAPPPRRRPTRPRSVV